MAPPFEALQEVTIEAAVDRRWGGKFGEEGEEGEEGEVGWSRPNA